MGMAVAIVGKGEAKTEKTCKHNVQTGNTTTTESFTNTASLANLSQIDNASTSVLVNNKTIILKKTTISKSTGCEKEGSTVLAGLVSMAPPNGPCSMEEGSSTVFIEGSKVVRKDDKTSQDSGNAPGKITDGSDNVFAGG